MIPLYNLNHFSIQLSSSHHNRHSIFLHHHHFHILLMTKCIIDYSLQYLSLAPFYANYLLKSFYCSFSNVFRVIIKRHLPVFKIHLQNHLLLLLQRHHYWILRKVTLSFLHHLVKTYVYHYLCWNYSSSKINQKIQFIWLNVTRIIFGLFQVHPCFKMASFKTLRKYYSYFSCP